MSAICVIPPFKAFISTVVPAVMSAFIAAEAAESMSTEESAFIAPSKIMLPVESMSIIFPEIESPAVKSPPFELRTTF